ncbi:KilA-N domain-containing protein [Colletotrichum musicola]|uniref:KilA-N domain-containing protein n=1 Tax=Colletotrichum musicola TaxID=2175873 RepID=A0A8H6MKW0_9PEZI|nr:KilA-N domain-containing protein [Colletotrichum musicola]
MPSYKPHLCTTPATHDLQQWLSSRLSPPRLKGESNWSSWLVLIGVTLRATRVKKYMDSDVPEPATAEAKATWDNERDVKKFFDSDVHEPVGANARATWKNGRDVAYNLLISASELQIDKLLSAGWQDDRDPSRLMEALR